MTGDVHMDLNGRNGQPQAGVDVYGVDQRTRARVGIQCRGRSDDSQRANGRVTAAELAEEVTKARTFYPKLDVFVVLTTGPNDVHLKKAAAALSRRRLNSKGLIVRVHGWDWIEGLLARHLDLAIQYGLIAVLPTGGQSEASASRIAEQIGTRLLAAIDLMNTRRSADERFNIQSISKHLGFADWRDLEAIAEGRSSARLADLAHISAGLGINEQWLVEGKRAPFLVDPDDYIGADEQYASILRLNPQQIVFVRQEQKYFESIVVVQVDDFKWVTFHWDHPMSSHVGGTGRRQLFEYCCLMRRLYRNFDFPGGCRLLGRYVSGPDFMRLLEGEVYPGTLLGWGRNDDWWIDFAELAEERVEGRTAKAKELREAIYIARTVLAEFQDRSIQNGWMRNTLVEVGFPTREAKTEPAYRL